MRSPLSPVMADIDMESFKEIALGTSPLKSTMYRRYLHTLIPQETYANTATSYESNKTHNRNGKSTF